MREFVEAICEKNVDKAKNVADEILQEKGEESDELEEIPGIGSDLAKKIQMHGYDTLGKLANSPLEKLINISELSEGHAKQILDSAQEYVEKKFTDLPGVGKETAREIRKQGYMSIEDIAKSSVKELTEIPKVGKKGAQKILDYAQEKAGEELEDLPGVGKETAEEMRKKGFTDMKYIASLSVQDLTRIPNIGEKGAKEILEYAKDNPMGKIKDLPGVGKETAEEIKRHGCTVMSCIVESSIEELTEIPNIGKKGAEKIIEFAKEKSGGMIEDLAEVNEKTANNLRNYGFSSIEEIARSSLDELVTIPGMGEGRAKEVKQSARDLAREVGGDTQGYRRALKGLIEGLDDERSLSLSHKVADGKYNLEKLKEIRKEIDKKTSQTFRPPNEISYFEALSEFLDAVMELKQESNE